MKYSKALQVLHIGLNYTVLLKCISLLVITYIIIFFSRNFMLNIQNNNIPIVATRVPTQLGLILYNSSVIIFNFYNKLIK